MNDLFAPNAADTPKGPQPLAERLRPRAIDQVIGQAQILAADAPLGAMLGNKQLSSLIFWGPPGVGKTTLARLLADHTDLHFVQISAIFTGVPDLKKVFEAAKLRHANGRGTLLFVDEIHRFNKAQQDGFLPHMEDGTIILVGATTENPSFELNAALLSRAQVLVLERLGSDELTQLLERAEGELGLTLPLDATARETLIAMADGDGRALINLVEQVHSWRVDAMITDADLRKRLTRRAAKYDKSGDSHYNLISALHKSVRGSDPDAALYWFARMLEGAKIHDTWPAAFYAWRLRISVWPIHRRRRFVLGPGKPMNALAAPRANWHCHRRSPIWHWPRNQTRDTPHIRPHAIWRVLMGLKCRPNIS